MLGCLHITYYAYYFCTTDPVCSVSSVSGQIKDNRQEKGQNLNLHLMVF